MLPKNVKFAWKLLKKTIEMSFEIQASFFVSESSIKVFVVCMCAWKTGRARGDLLKCFILSDLDLTPILKQIFPDRKCVPVLTEKPLLLWNNQHEKSCLIFECENSWVKPSNWNSLAIEKTLKMGLLRGSRAWFGQVFFTWSLTVY